MRWKVIARGFVPASVVVGVTALALGAGSPAGAAKPLPPGCNLQYGGQTIFTKGGATQRYTFQGYNAVPPSHRAERARITWGDGKSGSATSHRRKAPFAKGCYVTNFSARHTYPKIRNCRMPVCSKAYHVTIRFHDAQTGQRHSLTKLRVVVGGSNAN